MKQKSAVLVTCPGNIEISNHSDKTENPSNSTNLSNSNWKKDNQDHASSKCVLPLKNNQDETLTDPIKKRKSLKIKRPQPQINPEIPKKTSAKLETSKFREK